MEERYWLRHPSLRGMLGPYDRRELRAALDAGSFPADSYVLPDHGQSEGERQASPHWRPLYILLDLPRPASAAPKPPSPPSATELAEQRRNELRRTTAYSLPRSLVAIGAMIGIGVASVTTIVALATLGSGNTIGTVVVMLAGLGWEVLVIIVVAAALQALFDLADTALHGHARQRSSA